MNHGQGNHGTNSFLLDGVFNDYYYEYVMLHKLQQLTNNFTCQKCWQVLNFQRFFDEETHECLRKIEGPTSIDQAHVVRHSHMGSESIEELKETTRTMFGLTQDSRTLPEDGFQDSLPPVPRLQNRSLSSNAPRSHAHSKNAI